MRSYSIVLMTAILITLAAVFFITRRTPAPEPQSAPRTFVWSVAMRDLKRIAISLPPAGKREAWVKHADRHWYFDRPNGPGVNAKRWGGGIPLLLSGPGAQRLVTNAATDEQLKIYGFKEPKMKLNLFLQNGEAVNIEVGDRTLDGQAYYIRKFGSATIYTVDYSWYEVLERLVLDPPYPAAE
jgi:hypothetical protein